MASISIRNLKEETYEAIKTRALKRGLSMEEEVRQLLEQASLETESIPETFKRFFGKSNGVELEQVLEEHRGTHGPMEL